VTLRRHVKKKRLQTERLEDLPIIKGAGKRRVPQYRRRPEFPKGKNAAGVEKGRSISGRGSAASMGGGPRERKKEM